MSRPTTKTNAQVLHDSRAASSARMMPTPTKARCPPAVGSRSGLSAPPAIISFRNSGRCHSRCKYLRGHLTGASVGSNDVAHRSIGRSFESLEGCVTHVGDLRPTDPAGQKCFDGDLVGSAQPGGCGRSDPAGIVGQRQAPERHRVGRLEVESAQLRPVDSTEGGARSGAGRPGHTRWVAACRAC